MTIHDKYHQCMFHEQFDGLYKQRSIKVCKSPKAYDRVGVTMITFGNNWLATLYIAFNSDMKIDGCHSVF